MMSSHGLTAHSSGFEAKSEDNKIGSKRTFRGWMALDKSSLQTGLKIEAFEAKQWEETDIDIKVTHCGVCGSDLHTIRSGWGPTSYPCCVGHEIIGEVVRVGKSAEGSIGIGDRVGIGPVIRVCGESTCRECSTGIPNYCPRRVPTYNSVLPNDHKTYGGFANYCRVPAQAAIRIPKGLESEAAAPLLCAGITAFIPLKEFVRVGKRVGIIGIGGLGHFAIMFAKALDFEHVMGISRREEKRADALALGADSYVATADEEDWESKYAGSLDLIVCTVSSAEMPLNAYLGLLRTGGHFCQVGLPERPLPPLEVFGLIEKKISINFNDIGSIAEVEELLQFVVKKKIKPWVETRRMRDVNEVLADMEAGKARYRYVLVNGDSDHDNEKA